MNFQILTSALVFVVTAILPATAMAYVGPGAGISLIGSTIGLLVALGTAIGFVIFWPLRSLLRRRRRSAPATGADGRLEAGGP